MNGTNTAKTAGTRQTISTAGSAGTTVSSSACGCGCHGQALPSEGCCKLTCFERPQYFCGQLLSDADLTAEETYFREKNKLYHRALDGFGVVCGLRMTCDRQCKGHITIGDGYAIDCCGNDLVVCQPRTFDVIGELRRKKWLVEIPRERDRDRIIPLDSEFREGYDSGNGDHDCIIKTCYYIGICYEEEALDFVTPYRTDCTPAPAPCQPTRIREGVRFEIYDKLPIRPNPLDEIGKRIECCFRMFRDGQFFRGLQPLAPRILDVLRHDDKNPDQEENEQAQDGRKKQTKEHEAHCLFEELRAQFLHELRTCPDQYNCNLEEQVYRLRAPCRDNSDIGPPALEAFTKLLELIQKYVFSCVLAQFAFQCPEPPDPCCVLIGSVEVENGRLTRVINYPRWYLWCFANFFEVLTYQLANDAACGNKAMNQTSSDHDRDHTKAGKNGCCPGFEVDACEFLRLFHADNRALEKAARTSVDAIQAVYRSLVDGFNFLRPNGIAPAVLNNMSVDKAETLAKELNFSVEFLAGPPPEAQDPLSALLANLIHRGTAPIAAFERENLVTGATRTMNAAERPVSKLETVSQAETSALDDRFKQLEDELRKLTEAAAKPSEEIAKAMESRINRMEEDLGKVKQDLAERVEHLWRKIFPH
jgi:hypothetical protein